MKVTQVLSMQNGNCMRHTGGQGKTKMLRNLCDTAPPAMTALKHINQLLYRQTTSHDHKSHGKRLRWTSADSCCSPMTSTFCDSCNRLLFRIFRSPSIWRHLIHVTHSMANTAVRACDMATPTLSFWTMAPNSCQTNSTSFYMSQGHMATNKHSLQPATKWTC